MDRIEPQLPRIKNVLHGAQAFCVLVGGILDIVFLVKGDHGSGATTFYIILCFLTIPALVYNGLTLMFVRSRAWGHAYAFAVLDIVFAILWLSAMASVAAANSTGFCTDVCSVTKTMVGFAFFVFFFFALTSVISLKNAAYYRAHGSLPSTYYPSQRLPQTMIDPDRDAFSAQDDDDAYAPVHRHSADSDRPSQNPFSDNTAYGGGATYGAAEGYGGDGRDSFGGPEYHRRASNDLYSSGAPMDGGSYGLGARQSMGAGLAPEPLRTGPPSYVTEDAGDKAPDYLGRFESELARDKYAGVPEGPDSYRVGAGLGRPLSGQGGSDRVNFPPAPY